MGELRRRARSWPFDSGKSAFCTIFRAEHAPLPRICYYKGKSLGCDNPGRLNVELCQGVSCEALVLLRRGALRGAQLRLHALALRLRNPMAATL